MGNSPRLVWGLALAQLMCWGALYYSFALFILPMERDLGWSRHVLTGALSLGLLSAGIAAPLVGRIIDRQGGRGVMVAGCLLAGVMFALWAWSPHPAVFYLAWCGLGIAQALTLYDAAFAVLVRQLGDEAPAAITRVTLVGGLASTASIPLIQAIIDSSNWRVAAGVLAATSILICAPLLAWSLPPTLKVRSGPTERETRPFAMRAVLVRGPFWGLMLAYSAAGLVFSAVTFHLIPLLHERGLAEPAVWIIALIGPAQVAARLVLLVAPFKLNARSLGRGVTLGLPLALLLLLPVEGGLWLVVAAALAYGAANGLMTILRGAATAEILGTSGFGAVNGAIAMPVSFAKAIAPSAAALLWVWGGYQLVLLAMVLAAMIGAAAFWLSSGPAPVRPTPGRIRVF